MKVIELGRHKPSVPSVIDRLDRHQDKIKNITAIIEWDDGSSDVVHNTKEVQDLCYEKEILTLCIQKEMIEVNDEI